MTTLGDIPHTFRWSTKTCSCGVRLDVHEVLPLFLFVTGDAPSPMEWSDYVNLAPGMPPPPDILELEPITGLDEETISKNWTRQSPGHLEILDGPIHHDGKLVMEED